MDYKSNFYKCNPHTKLVNNLPRNLIKFSKEIIQNKKFSKNEKEILDKITNDISVVYYWLMDLYKINVHFNLYITGGAVRDFICGNSSSIKDIDIVLSFVTDNTYISKFKLTKSIVEKKLGICLDNCQWNRRTKDSTKLYDITLKLIEKNIVVQKNYPPKDSTEKQEEYLNRYLLGVIKLHNEQFQYPIDILITKSNIGSFIKSFDFNICKLYLKLVDSFYSHNCIYHYPKGVEILSNFVFTEEFLKDYKDKKLTMDMSYRSLNDVNGSILNHLPRLKDKYPQYEVTFINNKRDKLYKEKISIAQHYSLSKLINDSISYEKPEAIKVNKI